jgi:CheY-specific phosphatase CheX
MKRRRGKEQKMIEHKPLYQAMLKAISQTLENMAFIEAKEHYNQEYDIPNDDLAWAYLVVLDPLQGEVRLALPKSALRELTGTIFSLEENEITQAHMADILHEILNTIAGLFMTNLLTDSQAFKIGLPESGQGPLPEIDADTISWKMITSDETPLQIYICGASFAALNL